MQTFESRMMLAKGIEGSFSRVPMLTYIATNVMACEDKELWKWFIL